MKNEDVVKAFINRSECRPSKLNLSSEYGKLYSYNTCIAQWYDGRIYLNATKYSSTTSRHQSLVRRFAPACIELYNNRINMGRADLTEFIELQGNNRL